MGGLGAYIQIKCEVDALNKYVCEISIFANTFLKIYIYRNYKNALTIYQGIDKLP